MAQKRKIQHLDNLWEKTNEICPKLAAFYLWRQAEDKKDGKNEKDNVPVESADSYSKCPYCNWPYQPGNHHIRILPRQKLTTRVTKLIQKYRDNPGSMGKFQQKIAHEGLQGNNRLAITCFTCKKTVKLEGQSRDARQQQKLSVYQSIQEVTVVKPKTKSQKKKEKRKKKGLTKGKKDVNAGLVLDRMSTNEGQNDNNLIDTEAIKPDNSHEETDAPCVTQTTTNQNNATGDHVTIVSTNQKQHTNDHVITNSTNKQDSYKKPVKPSKSAIRNANTLSKPTQIGSYSPGRVQKSSKKIKNKKLGGHLGHILKQDKKGKSSQQSNSNNQSLADFLQECGS